MDKLSTFLKLRLICVQRNSIYGTIVLGLGANNRACYMALDISTGPEARLPALLFFRPLQACVHGLRDFTLGPAGGYGLPVRGNVHNPFDYLAVFGLSHEVDDQELGLFLPGFG